MKKKLQTLIFLFFSTLLIGQQNSEIIKLDEKNSYQYFSYHSNGNIKQDVGFYAKRPFESVNLFEEKLKKYKIRKHGPTKEFYENAQLKEIVIYRKGKVIHYAKHYFEDGEEYSVNNDEFPSFQFTLEERSSWFANKITQIEQRIGRELMGFAWIVLEISKTGEVKQIKIGKSSDESNNEFLIEIGKQIKVVKPAIKDGQHIATRHAFKIDL